MGGLTAATPVRTPFSRACISFSLVAAFVLLLGSACGGGTESRIPIATFTETNLENRVITNLSTLEEAQQLASFEIRLPRDETFGFEFLGGSYTPPIMGGRGGNPIDDNVAMIFGNDEQQVHIVQAAAGLAVGGSSEPVEVAAVTGKLVRAEPSRYPSTIYISWTKEDRSFIASTTTTETFTLEDLLTFLGTIS